MEIEIKRLIKPLVKKWWIIILSASILAVTVYQYTNNYITPVYSTYTTMYIQNTTDYQGYISSGDILSSRKLLSTYVVLLESISFMEKVAEKVDLGYSSYEIRSMVSASSVNDTEVLRVQVRNVNPFHAQNIANAIGEVAPTEIMRVFNAGNVAVIDEAILPNFPAYPNTSQNTLLGGLIGLIIACGIILLKEMLDTRIRTERDLRQIISIPVIGIVPNAIYKRTKKKVKKRGFKERMSNGILTKDSLPIVSEAYRNVRTNLMFLLSNKQYKRVLVTSASPAEGKTTTCTNLAITFARANKKVLIIDGDMRNPGIHKLFEIPSNPGLSDILGGFSDYDCIKKSYIENLFILPAGTLPPNPAELLVSTAFDDLIKHLSEKYDYIFMDTPPANLFADTVSISDKLDGVILVAKYAQSRRESLVHMVGLFEKVNANLLGGILNNFDRKNYYEQFGSGKKAKYYSNYGYDFKQ